MKYPCQHGVTNFCRVCEEVERHLNRPHPEQNTQRPKHILRMVDGGAGDTQVRLSSAPQTEAGDVEMEVSRLLEYINDQFPATVGHIPIPAKVWNIIRPLTQRIAELEKDLAENETVRRLACYGQDMRFERNAAIKRAEAAEARVKELEEKYYELIYAVAQKYEGETRHQTALRYIIERESNQSGTGAKSI